MTEGEESENLLKPPPKEHGVLCYYLALAPGNFVNQGSEKRNCKHKQKYKGTIHRVPNAEAEV